VNVQPRTDTETDRRHRLIVVLGSAGAVLCAVPLMIYFGLTGWPYAYLIAGIGSAVFLMSALHRRDTTMLHIWWFALAFGLAELAVDAWLVSATGTLDYEPYASRGGPMWWASPAFMPFAWQVLIAHLATLTDAVSHWRISRRLLFALLIGAAYVPLGEELSIRAGFWLYRNVPTLSHVPLYILIGELALAVAVVMLLPSLARGHALVTAIAGVIAAVALWGGYAVGLALF
jgi:hypothetical protein